MPGTGVNTEVLAHFAGLADELQVRQLSQQFISNTGAFTNQHQRFSILQLRRQLGGIGIGLIQNLYLMTFQQRKAVQLSDGVLIVINMAMFMPGILTRVLLCVGEAGHDEFPLGLVGNPKSQLVVQMTRRIIFSTLNTTG